MKKKILFTNGIIHTGESETETFSSMLVENGKIVALDPQKAEDAETVSLNGRHVYPCLIDGHMHLLETLVASAGFNVCNIENGKVEPSTIAEVKGKISLFAKTKSKNALILGKNYIASAIDEGRMPNRFELDEWCNNRPVVIYSKDGHASAVSTKMLRRLGIAAEGHDGILYGKAHEAVQGQMNDFIAKSVTLKIIAKGVANFHNACREYGISCVGALEGNGDSKKDKTIKLIINLASRFSVDVKIYFQYIDVKKALPLIKYQRRPRIGGCGDWEMDGACGAHTAAFPYPYKDTGKIASTYYTQKFINKTVKEANAAGMQIASHAIGSDAIDRIINAFDTIKPSWINRIEHCEFPTKSAVDLIAKHGYAVMMQPGYSWVDKRFLHTYEKYLSDEVLDMLCLKTMIDKGILVCGSSDSPVQEMDPWLQMMGMTQYYQEEESITPFEAFCCYTANSAKAILEEDERGTLLPGKKADFFTADCNIFELNPKQLGAFRPIKTYYGGMEAHKWKGTLTELMKMMLKRPHQI